MHSLWKARVTETWVKDSEEQNGEYFKKSVSFGIDILSV